MRVVVLYRYIVDRRIYVFNNTEVFWHSGALQIGLLLLLLLYHLQSTPWGPFTETTRDYAYNSGVRRADGQTDRHDDNMYRASIASRRKKTSSCCATPRFAEDRLAPQVVQWTREGTIECRGTTNLCTVSHDLLPRRPLHTFSLPKHVFFSFRVKEFSRRRARLVTNGR